MDRRILKALSLITQLGVSMVMPIGLCFFCGLKGDEYFGTSPLLLFIFIIIGIGAGFRSVYMITRPYFKGKDSYIDISKYKEKSNEKEDRS